MLRKMLIVLFVLISYLNLLATIDNSQPNCVNQPERFLKLKRHISLDMKSWSINKHNNLEYTDVIKKQYPNCPIDKIGQLFIIEVPLELTCNDHGYEVLRDYLSKLSIGGVIFLNQVNLQFKNYKNSEILTEQDIEKNTEILANFIQKIQPNQGEPLFMSIDQEGGKVRRIKNYMLKDFKVLPSAKNYGIFYQNYFQGSYQTINNNNLKECKSSRIAKKIFPFDNKKRHLQFHKSCLEHVKHIQSHSKKSLYEIACTPESIEFDFFQLGKTMRKYGFNWNFAPVLDLESESENPVIAKLNRAISYDPIIVNEVSNLMIDGLSKAGVISSGKHFPGHGDTINDSHTSLVSVNKTEDQLFCEELIPFENAARNSIPSIMIGHIMFPKIKETKGHPATLSQYMIKNILREKLGYKGVVITDDLSMSGVKDYYTQHLNKNYTEIANDALKVGNNMMIVRHGYEVSMVKNICEELATTEQTCSKNPKSHLCNDELKKSIDSSYKKVINLKQKFLQN